MLRFIARRISFIALICVLIVFFVYLGMRVMSRSEGIVRNSSIGDYTRYAWKDTTTFFNNVLRGKLGTIAVENATRPLDEFVKEAYSNSMGLLLVALGGAAVLGLYIGSVAALTRYKALVLPLLTLTMVGVSAPSFFAGLLLQQGELLYLRTTGRPLVSMAGFGWDYKHMLMPVLVLAARPLAYLTRAAFLGLTQVMEEDYIRTAFSKGLSFRRTVNTHALRNMAVPVLTAVGVSLRFALGTLPVVELFFAWPGLGLHLLQAIQSRRTPVVVVLSLALGLTFLLSNLLLDILYRLIDPRLREAT